VFGEHPVYVNRRQLDLRIAGIGPGALKLAFMIELTNSETLDLDLVAGGGQP